MNPSNFFDISEPSSTEVSNRSNYKDMLAKKGNYVRRVAIPSKTITEPFLHITIPYTKWVEDDIIVYDSLLKPKSDERGYEFGVNIKFGPDEDTTKVEAVTYLQHINDMFEFKIDSTKIRSDLIIASNEDVRLNLEIFVDLLGYSRGKHILTIKHKIFKGDSTATKKFATIPFWYYNENATIAVPLALQKTALDKLPEYLEKPTDPQGHK
jgi:hypothetical protein